MNAARRFTDVALVRTTVEVVGRSGTTDHARAVTLQNAGSPTIVVFALPQ